jgi:hypothetical protein
MNLLKLTRGKGSSKPIEPASVNVSLVRVSSSINLVEISHGKPFHIVSGLLSNQLIEEIIFASIRSWAIHRGNLESDTREPYLD